jgi:DNA repair protein RecN (Recombination protein N)
MWTDADSALRKHEEKTRTLNEKRDILEFQFKELKSLDLHIGEEAELEAELALLSSSAERSTCAAEILEQLGESDDSIQKKVTIIKRKLENLEKFDASVDQWTTDIENARSLFSELETFCSSYLGKAQDSADPARIEKINSRLAKIQRLKKKYACNVEQLLNKLSSLQSDLLSIENVESDHIELQKRVSETLQACIEFGQKLRTAREHATKDFDLKISALMETLGFNGGLWKTSFEALDKPSPVGLDSCIFLVRTNSGESLLPLAKTASGGEISRLMLAIKTVLAEHDNIPVLIFDEIDTGIGGVLAGEVGKAMYNLSRSHQILCISHLHQIACMADHHFQVHKEVISDRTVTKVNHLDYDQKIFEIARMLGGNDAISIEHARKLLRNTGV